MVLPRKIEKFKKKKKKTGVPVDLWALEGGLWGKVVSWCEHGRVLENPFICVYDKILGYELKF